MLRNNRRDFIKSAGVGIIAGGLFSPYIACNTAKGIQQDVSSAAKDVSTAVKDIVTDKMFFDISLAEWSLNKALFGGELDNLDFAAKAKSFNIDAIEYVNQFFKDKAEDTSYLSQLNQRADDNGVKQLLIMIDGEGGLGDPKDKERVVAVQNHYKWVDAAKYLGCHSIRVNAYGQGSSEDVAAAAVNSLGALSEYAAKEAINIIVENHGGYSSDGSWLAGVMSQVNMDNCGTLPDFGNFCIERGENWSCKKEYDRYKGVTEMMPFAKAVSAKTEAFDEMGNETKTDYMKMMKIVKDHGFRGYVGIEFEGRGMSEDEGIMKTRDLLIKVGKALS